MTSCLHSDACLRCTWSLARNADNMSKKTKVCLYQSLVHSLLLYNSETWTLKEEHKQKLKVLEMSVLSKILGVTRRDRWKNVDIMKALDIDTDITKLLQIRRLSYFGYVSRTSAGRLPYIALFGRTEESWTRGRPRKMVGQHQGRLYKNLTPVEAT